MMPAGPVTPDRRRALLRLWVWICIALHGAMLALMVWSAATARSDAAGNAMAEAFAVVAGFAFVLFALPALVLAIIGRALIFALVWAGGSLVLLFFVMFGFS